jgi:pyruvate dehydrogenase E2 component (dihydrolipoamide acetyltransferase)
MFKLSSKSIIRTALNARYLHVSNSVLAAKIFDMPAMSPTMESGAIVEWKVKPGEAYNSGDPLLDIETDKATISVDAIDDGILAKILLPDGTKDIKVGTPIAYIAEEGDDVTTLEYPALPSEVDSKPKQNSAQPSSASQSAPTHTSNKTVNSSESNPTIKPTPSSSSTIANPNQRLFPSVELLLGQNNISKEEALKKIPATGPYGRILKGDVLAYLGKISSSENTIIAQYLEKTSHLDLSNIELRESTPSNEKSNTKKSSVDLKIKEPVIVSETYPLALEITYPELHSFKNAISKAISLTEQKTYAYNLDPESDLNDPLFDDIVAPPRNAERFTISYKLNAEDTDILSIDINLTLNESCYDAKERAALFLSKFKDDLAESLKDF